MIKITTTKSVPVAEPSLPTEGLNIERSKASNYPARDSMFEQAARCIVLHQDGSTSLLQRELKMGYNRVGRVFDQLQAAGIVGPPVPGSKDRPVLIADEHQLEQLLATLAVPPPIPVALSERQQLEVALQAGAITPELFTALTAKLHLSDTELVPGGAPAAHAPLGLADEAELPSLLSLFESAPAPAASPSVTALRLPAEQTHVVPLQAPIAEPFVQPGQPVSRSASTAVLPGSRAEAMALPEEATDTEDFLEEEAPSRLTLSAALASLGGVGLLCLVFYLFTSRPQLDEALISTATPSVGIAAATSESSETLEPETRPEVTLPASTVESSAPEEQMQATEAMSEQQTEAADALSPSSEESIQTGEPEDAAAPVPAAPEPGDDEATLRVRSVMADYYADLFAPPLNAASYFAPQVERLYIQHNLTPTQIDEDITRTFFSDNKQAVYQIEPGTLRVTEPANDGARTATYIEACRLWKVSKGRYQRLRTQVRVRFDEQYRITFMRQEKLLDNVFE